MMKIINSILIAGLLGGTAWAGDGFYLIDLDTPNGITYVQRQGNRYYYSSGDQLEQVTQRIRANRERRAERNRALLEGLLD